MQEKGIVGSRKSDVLPEQGRFEKLIITVQLIENMIVALNERTLILSHRQTLIVEAQRRLSYQSIALPEFSHEFAD